ncbi:MAG: hypothetical protein ACYC2U_07320, partial [Candidatus Amoebophilus sp.]
MGHDCYQKFIAFLLLISLSLQSCHTAIPIQNAANLVQEASIIHAVTPIANQSLPVQPEVKEADQSLASMIDRKDKRKQTQEEELASYSSLPNKRRKPTLQQSGQQQKEEVFEEAEEKILSTSYTARIVGRKDKREQAKGKSVSSIALPDKRRKRERQRSKQPKEESTHKIVQMPLFLPSEMWCAIFSFLPWEAILSARGANRFFYTLISGYDQLSMRGVSHQPKWHANPCFSTLNKHVNFRENQKIRSVNPETIPSFLFYHVIRQVDHLPRSYWPYLSNTYIHALNLSWNYIKDSGLIELAPYLPASRIHTLDLKDNLLQDQGMLTLTKYLPQTAISVLDVRANQLGDSGLISLAKVLPQTAIHTLYLNENRISDQGIIALAKQLPQTTLHTLGLSGNQISNVGMRALAKQLPQTQIHTLDIGSNQISDRGVSKSAKYLTKSQLHTLHLEYNTIND